MGKGAAFRCTDGLLLCHGLTAAAIGRPAVGTVVDGPLLLEGSVPGKQGRVVCIIQAQIIQLPGGAHANFCRCGGLLLAHGHGGSEVRVEVIADSIYPHLPVKPGNLGCVHQFSGQGQQIVAVSHRDGRILAERHGLLGAGEGVAQGYILLGLGVIHHAVSIAQHGAVILQSGLIGAAEAIAAVGIRLVIGQRTGFEGGLPVAIVAKALQSGVGIRAQTHAVHQVIGHGIAAARFRRKGIAEILLHGGGAVLPAPFLEVHKSGARQVLIGLCHVVDPVDRRIIFIGVGAGRGIGQPFPGQRSAGRVAGVHHIPHTGDAAGYQARRLAALQKACGIAVGKADIGRAIAIAHKAACLAGGIYIRIRIRSGDAGRAACKAHQPTCAGAALQNGGGKAAGNRQAPTAGAAHKAACGSAAAEPHILLGFPAELIPGGAEIDLTALHRCGAAEAAHKAACISGCRDLRAAQADVAQGTLIAFKQAAVTRRYHRQTVNHRVEGLAAYHGGGIILTKIPITDGREGKARIDAVPAVFLVGIDKLNVLLLHDPGNGPRQTGIPVQILQVAGIGHHGCVSALHTGKKAVGRYRLAGRVHLAALALHLYINGQVRAGCQVFKSLLLGKAHAVCQTVKHHAAGIGAIGRRPLAVYPGKFHAAGRMALCIPHGDIAVQQITGGIAGDFQHQLLLVDDTHLGGKLARLL